MRNWLSYLILTLAFSAAIPAAVSSCGAMVGMAVVLDDDGYYDPFDYDHGLLFYDGYWRGDYVYYHGRWYRHGIGTPYWDDWYDPYPYWW